MTRRYRLFSWEFSYFSGKVRAYMRYKDHFDALGPGYEDILCSFDLVHGLLAPNTGSTTVPQVLAPDGTWIHDSSEIIDYFEQLYPETPATPDPRTRPQQALAAHLIELLADEWMVVWGFWERWHHSLEGVEPNHLQFNLQQWGSAFAPDQPGRDRRAAARKMYDAVLGDTVHAGLKDLGMTERTEAAWTTSIHRILERLENHFDRHDYVLGGRPSLADFGLLGPLYAHLYRDPVSGFDLRVRYPLVTQWVERTNGTNALDARSYNQRLYSLVDGELVGRPATSNGGEWLDDDAIPETLGPVLAVFFEEMWPVLDATIDRATTYIASDAHPLGGELPSYTFHASPGFEEAQRNDGALTHEFRIGDTRERRMVVPYHLWMLQRIADVVRAGNAAPGGRATLEQFLRPFVDGPAILDLDARLAGCRVRKDGGRIFSET